MSPLPEPGRTTALERDLEDAEHILAVLRGLTAFGNTSGTRQVLKETLWFLWEKPRLPGPLVRSKYPLRYPWSPSARALHESHASKGLIIEHLEPTKLLLADLLASPHDHTPSAFAATLHARKLAAVVTADDDRVLSHAGFGQKMPPGETSPWARYVAAGLDLAQFRPIHPPSPCEEPAT